VSVDDEIRRGIEQARQSAAEFEDHRRRERAEELEQQSRSAEIGAALGRFRELMRRHGNPGAEPMRMERSSAALRGWVVSTVAVGPEASSVYLLFATDGRLFHSYGRPFEWRGDARHVGPWELTSEYELGTAEHRKEKDLEEGIPAGIGKVLAEQRIGW
jgi:hypothetical protein